MAPRPSPMRVALIAVVFWDKAVLLMQPLRACGIRGRVGVVPVAVAVGVAGGRRVGGGAGG
jgi:hypothetical protein